MERDSESKFLVQGNSKVQQGLNLDPLDLNFEMYTMGPTPLVRKCNKRGMMSFNRE